MLASFCKRGREIGEREENALFTGAKAKAETEKDLRFRRYFYSELVAAGGGGGVCWRDSRRGGPRQRGRPA